MKPGIIVLSPNDDESFRWISDGWFEMAVRHTEEAQALYAKAHEAITSGTDVLDVIERLRNAGFEVTRDDGTWTSVVKGVRNETN